jgi:hypothetical protein
VFFSKYLPKIAQFSAKLAGKDKPPDIDKLIKERENVWSRRSIKSA